MYRSDLKPRDKGGAIAAVVGIHPRAAVRVSQPVGQDRPWRPAKHPSHHRAWRAPAFTPSAATAATPAAEAKIEGGRLGAEEHQERSDTGGCAQAQDRHAPGAADRRQRDPAARGRADPGCVGCARARNTVPAEFGNGTGNGAGGNGPGGGGDNGVAEPPHLATPVLTGRDFPRGLFDQWPRGATVFLRLRVDSPGHCQRMHGRSRDRGSGNRRRDLQHCARAASLSARAQPRRTSGCRMVRIRATSAALGKREST